LSANINNDQLTVGLCKELYFIVEGEKYPATDTPTKNSFTTVITGLNRTETYDFQGCITIRFSNIMIYSNWGSFAPGVPKVSTKSMTNVGTNSAIFNGELTQIGGASFCEVWFKYGTSKDNLNQSTIRKIVNSTGLFKINVTNLTSCKSYYYRAYARNDIPADKYGTVTDSFFPGLTDVETLDPSEIGVDSALLNGELLNIGGASNCSVWFVIDGNETPHIQMNSTGIFSEMVDNLTSCKEYNYYSVVDNGACIDIGSEKSFNPGQPSVETNDVTDIELDTAVLNGELINMGGTTECNVRFEFGLSEDNLTTETAPTSMSSPGTFNRDFKMLHFNTTYYFRAVAYNGYCTDYGSIKSFKTLG